MANTPQDSPPLLPVIPLYKPWLDRVIKETAADAKAVDAGFAARQGPVAALAEQPARSLDEPRGVIADEKA